jgi:lipopolysaccharide exporter
VMVNVIGAVIGIGTTYWICKRRLPHVLRLRWRFNRNLARQLLQIGIPTGLSLTAISSIITQFDNFLIGTFVGYTTLGFYDRAYRLANWSNILTMTIVYYIGFVTFAKVQHDLPRLTHAVRLTLWVLTIICLPIGLVFFFGAADLIDILYGAKWSEAALYLRFLVVYTVLSPFIGVGFWLSVALGQKWTATVITGVQLGVLIVLATPLTLLFGVIGTIVGVAISMIAGFVLSVSYISRQISLSPWATLYVPLLAVSLAVLILSLLPVLSGWHNLPPAARLFIVSVGGGGVFIASLFALRPAETIERIRYLKRTWGKS